MSVIIALFALCRLLSANDQQQQLLFVFEPNTNVNNRDSWLNSQQPSCIDDRIIFDRMKPIATIIGGGDDVSLLVSTIVLPDDGVILFDYRTVIGVPGKRQCTERAVGDAQGTRV